MLAVSDGEDRKPSTPVNRIPLAPLPALLAASLPAFLTGCGPSADDGEPKTTLPPSSLPGVYSGTFPCDNCAGIDVTLWLRADGRFFLRRRYADADAGDDGGAYNLGRWHWSADDDALVLNGAGPGRAFSRPDPDRLVMRTDSPLDHSLTRDAVAADFTDRIGVEGTARLDNGRVTMTECLTGLAAAVEGGGEYARFVRQLRSVGVRGEPALVEIEGRFSWSDGGAPEALSVERLLAVRPDETC